MPKKMLGKKALAEALRKADAKELAELIFRRVERCLSIPFTLDDLTQMIAIYRPSCYEHGRKLVCPSCVARARGAKGGRARVQNAATDKQIAAAGRKGGRKKALPHVQPATLQTPMTEF